MAAPELVERAKARVGSVLRDKWRLDSLLGVGGSAAVYSATHRNGKRGAIKLLHAELAVQTDFVTRFLREGYVANKIEHPGAVSILDDDHTEDGIAFLVMELLEGYTLERRLRKQSAFPVKDALKIVEDLLDIVNAAHDKGIIHRDLKPANIFVTKKGEVKVLDFGIARLGEAHHLSGSTQMGMPLGTPAFMPPEQARGRWGEVDVRTDLWAVGATMWALLSGQRPRRAETANEELLLAMTEPLPPVASVAPHVSEEVSKLVDRAVAFDMSARWPNARTMQQALRLALLLEQANEGAPAVTADKPRPAEKVSTGTMSGLGGFVQLPEVSPPSPPAGRNIPAPAAESPSVAPAPPSPSVAPTAPAPQSSGDAPQSLTTVRPFPLVQEPKVQDAKDVVNSLEGPPSLNFSGALSLSRYDALGERRPRLPGGANPTPSGEQRLLTTETPLVAGARAMLNGEPAAAPRRSGFLLAAALGVAVIAGAFFAYKSGWLGGVASQAGPAPATIVDAGAENAANTADAATLAVPPPVASSELADAGAAPTTTTSAAADAAASEAPHGKDQKEPKEQKAEAPPPVVHHSRPRKPRASAEDAGATPSAAPASEAPAPVAIPPFVDPDSSNSN